MLGRASNVGAYVKRGEDSGSVRIMLRGDTSEERINITRRIDTHNKSDWTVNGTPAPKLFCPYISGVTFSSAIPSLVET